jgi:hypothetical protein
MQENWINDGIYVNKFEDQYWCRDGLVVQAIE